MAFTILLADKSFLARCLLKKNVFEKHPEINLIEVDNSYSALDIMNSGQIDLAILDVQMPQINGIVLTKKSDATLPVILLSYCDEVYYKNHLPRENVIGIVQKPGGPVEFELLLKKAGFNDL